MICLRVATGDGPRHHELIATRGVWAVTRDPLGGCYAVTHIPSGRKAAERYMVGGARLVMSHLPLWWRPSTGLDGPFPIAGSIEANTITACLSGGSIGAAGQLIVAALHGLSESLRILAPRPRWGRDDV